MALAFLVANFILTKEIERKRIVPEDDQSKGRKKDAAALKNEAIDVASMVTAISIFLGIAGSKLFHILENLGDFFRDPIGMIANGGGLTFYGGLILAALGNYFYLRSKKILILKFFDAAAPALMIAYGIGRIGCLLAGDGDYGQPTKLPWAMTYPNGVVPTLAAQNPDLAKRYREMYPAEPVPVDIPVHPAPVYETLYSLVIFALLWKLRTEPRPDGWIFFLYLALQAACRFMVELIRINNVLVFGLSQAQVISLALLAIGLVGLWRVSGKPGGESPEKIKGRADRKALTPT